MRPQVYIYLIFHQWNKTIQVDSKFPSTIVDTSLSWLTNSLILPDDDDDDNHNDSLSLSLIEDEK